MPTLEVYAADNTFTAGAFLARLREMVLNGRPDSAMIALASDECSEVIDGACTGSIVTYGPHAYLVPENKTVMWAQESIPYWQMTCASDAQFREKIRENGLIPVTVYPVNR